MALADVLQQIEAALSGIKPAAGKVGETFAAMSGVLDALGPALGTLAANVVTMGVEMLAALGPVGLLVAAVEALVAAFAWLANQAREKFQQLLDAAKKVGDALLDVAGRSREWVAKLSPATIELFNRQIANLQATLGQAFVPLWQALGQLVQQIAAAIQPAMQKLVPVIQQVIQALLPLATTAIQVAGALLNTAVSILTTVLGGSFRTLGQVAQWLADKLIQVTVWISRVLGLGAVFARSFLEVQESKSGLQAAPQNLRVTGIEELVRSMQTAFLGGQGTPEDQTAKNTEHIKKVLNDAMKGPIPAVWDLLGRCLAAWYEKNVQSRIDNPILSLLPGFDSTVGNFYGLRGAVDPGRVGRGLTAPT